MSDIIVCARNVTRKYILGDEEVYAINGITLDVERGEYISIMGPSGSGKTTFFNMVGGIDQPTSGEVLIEDYHLASLNQKQLSWIRCHRIGYIFQSFNLIPTMSALENVSIAAIFKGHSPSQARQEAAAVLERVGLGHRLEHLPSEVSGGQQQRIAIARALVNKPTIILADEPTGNLDLHTGQEIIRLLDEMKKEFGITIITATHDMKMLSASDRVIEIEDGKIKHIRKKGEVEIEVGTVDGQEVS